MEQGAVTSLSNGQGEILALFTDRRGAISKSNKAFLEKFGYSQDALQAKAINDLLHDDVPTAILASILSAMRHGKVWMGLIKLASPTEAAHWMKVTVAPVSGQTGNFLWTFVTPDTDAIIREEKRFARINSGALSLKKGYLRRKIQWLRDLPLGYKLGGSITMLTVFVVVTLVANELFIVSSAISEEEQYALEKYSNAVNASIQDMEQQVISMATMVAEMPATQEALLNHDREALLASFEKPFKILKERYKIRQFQFHLAPATSFLRLHRPEKYGDDLSSFRKTVVAANESGKPVAALEKGKAGYGIRGVVPVIFDGRNVGSVEFGKAFGQDFFSKFKIDYGVDAAFITLENRKANVMASTLKGLGEIPKEKLLQVFSGTNYHGEVKLGGKIYSTYAQLLKEGSGNPAGVLITALDSTPRLAHLAQVRNQVLVLAALAIFMSILVSYFLARVLSRPVLEASKVAGRIANGFYDNDVTLNSNDEAGRLLGSMATMQAVLGFNLHETRERAEENARVKIALDYISTNVTVSNTNGDLIFMNNACMSLFDRLAQTQTGNELFHASNLLGTHLDEFFNDDRLKTIFAAPLREPETVFYAIWGHEFKLIVSPVYDKNDDYQGRVTQWVDITNEVTVEREIQSIVTAAESGDLSQRIALGGKEGFFLELASGINALINSVDQVIEDIATAMGYVAKGNLTQPITREYQGTFEAVKNSVNETIAGLEKMVRELRDASVEISDSSNEITSGNDELSHRTEQQASNIETTAASMEEITGTVNQNSANAQEATTLAADAQAVSQEGVGVVRNLIQAMDTINESSSKIEQIIHVIDEIAFQTNLLALNAAVEAARAGEQGRGFAVVASEVRDLAGRSSDAAKQIKTLISASVERVTNGTELVNNAGDTLDAIAGSISKVSTIMNEIAHANQEQAIGIQQVNRSITQIDEATQQNTALAEQTSAVAISLKNQSRELDEMIQKFIISSESGNQEKGQYLHAV